MSISLRYRQDRSLGSGGYGIVYYAIEDSGRAVALKKSRVSQMVKRPILRYESRVLGLLQGHPAIPQIYGYGQLPHFEYLTMELLGPSIKSCMTSRGSVENVVSVVVQMLSVLEHVHNRGFVHRDIKPDNILYSLLDPSKIFLIDFGIASRIRPPPPNTRSDALKSIVGTLHWASLNAHDGTDLGPRDDLESLAYIAFFLLHGDLPWMSSGPHDVPIEKNMSTEKKMARIRESKSAVTGRGLCVRFGFPAEFGFLLDYSRRLEYVQTPNYADMIKLFTLLNERLHDIHTERPLDWKTVEISKARNGISDKAYIEYKEYFVDTVNKLACGIINKIPLDWNAVEISKGHNGISSDRAYIEHNKHVKSDEDNGADSNEIFTNSYFSENDIGDWPLQTVGTEV